MRGRSVLGAIVAGIAVYAGGAVHRRADARDTGAGDVDPGGFLSTHPATGDRIDVLRKL